jgi:hypothetical protein
MLALTTCGCSAEAPSAEDVGQVAEAVFGPTLPSGFVKTKIGTVGSAVDATYDPGNGDYQIVGSGAGLFKTNGQTGSDNFYFVNKSLAGDGEVTMDFSGYTGNAELNIEVRSQLNATSSHVQLGRSSAIYRQAINGPVNSVGYNYAGTLTKLVRRGNTITGYSSSDGVYWTPANPPVSVTLSGIGAAAAYGVELASGSPTGTETGWLRSLLVGRLPLSLTAQDVGAPTPAGSANINYAFNGGSFTLSGGGAGIKGTADAFQFTYRTLVGDGTVIAQVEPPNGSAAVSAGLMVRKSLSSNASNVFVAMNNSDELVTTSRTTSGGNTSAPVRFTAGQYGGWIKLTRTGSSIASFSSVDGVTWTPFRTVSLTDLSSTVYVGLAIASSASGTLGTTTADHFQFAPVADQP